VACDLHEEAPIWWLRVKQAAERGATVVVANARPTRLDKYARCAIRYKYGEEVEAVKSLAPEYKAEVPEDIFSGSQRIAGADSLVVFYGSDGLGLEGSMALGRACADLLVKTAHLAEPTMGW